MGDTSDIWELGDDAVKGGHGDPRTRGASRQDDVCFGMTVPIWWGRWIGVDGAWGACLLTVGLG